MTTMSEALAGCLVGQADVPDDMFELVAGLAVDDGCSAVSEWLLQHERLPLETAEKLVARRGVSAVELSAFASREDMPPETLLEWVRKERRVTVLAQIAAKPDLPREVFETLATRKGTKLRNALLLNESAPVEVQAGIAADLLGADVSRASDDALREALRRSGTLQRAVFARLSPDVLQRLVSVASQWDGLTMRQLHSLLDAVERYAAAIPPTTDSATRWERNKANTARSRAQAATSRLAEHPTADEALLYRLETLAADNAVCCPADLNEAVAVARQRLALLGGCSEQLHSVPHSKLVELADSGVLCTTATAQQAVRSPLFDADVAVRILKAANRRYYTTERLLLDWAPDLVSALRVYRAVYDQPPYTLSLAKHVAAASTGELLEAVNGVADCPEWGWSLIETIATTAADGAVTDEVVGQLGWFPDFVAGAFQRGAHSRSAVLTAEYLYRRFGAHRPTWQVFASIADPTTSLADAADLAIHAEPPPAPPPQTTPAPPAPEAQCEQVSLF